MDLKASLALVAAANVGCRSHLKDCCVSSVFQSRIGEAFEVSYSMGPELSDHERVCIVNIFEDNMRVDYSRTWGMFLFGW